MSGDKLSQDEIDALLRGGMGGDGGATDANDSGQEPQEADSQDAAAATGGAGGVGGADETNAPDEATTDAAREEVGAASGETGAAVEQPVAAPPPLDAGEEPLELSELERDVISEVANISMGSAATAASSLVNRKVVITAPRVTMSTPAEVWQQFEQPTLVVEIQYLKGLEGKSVFILGPRDAGIIADLMMGGDGLNPPDQLDELHLSAVTEAMNQMMGGSATAMAHFFGFRVDISAPEARLTEGGDERMLLANERMVAVYFRLTIEGVIDSHFMQLMPLPFAYRVVEMAMRTTSKDDAAQPTEAVPSAETPTGTAPPPTAEATPTPARPGEAAATGVPPGGAVATGAPSAEGAAPVTPAAFPSLDESPKAAPLDNVSLELVRHIPVEVSATLGEAEMNMKDVMRLATGAIVHLNTEENDLVRVFANGVEIARGEVVVVGEQYGVRITDIVGAAQRLDTLRGRP